MHRDPLIIGAGPAGTAAAITLGQAGHRPLLIERATSPADKVCGDFLSVDAIEWIRRLGVDPMCLGASPIHRVRLIAGHRTVEATLPFPALGLSRRALDAALLRRAQEVGAHVRMGETVRHLRHGARQWQVQTSQATITADTVFLATGKHDLRDLPRTHAGTGAVGMKMYLDLAPGPVRRLKDTTELTLFPGGYAGLQCVEHGKAVLCIAVKRQAFQAYGSGWTGLLAAIEQSSPHFAGMIAGAVSLLPRPLAVAGIPYGYQAISASTEGLFRLGDQAAVIPSLTGDGLAIALFSGQLAAEAWLAGADGVSYQDSLAQILAPQMRLAAWLHRGGLSGRLQTGAVHLLGWFPGLLRQAAMRTRLPRVTSSWQPGSALSAPVTCPVLASNGERSLNGM